MAGSRQPQLGTVSGSSWQREGPGSDMHHKENTMPILGRQNHDRPGRRPRPPSAGSCCRPPQHPSTWRWPPTRATPPRSPRATSTATSPPEVPVDGTAGSGRNWNSWGENSGTTVTVLAPTMWTRAAASIYLWTDCPSAASAPARGPSAVGLTVESTTTRPATRSCRRPSPVRRRPCRPRAAASSTTRWSSASPRCTSPSGSRSTTMTRASGRPRCRSSESTPTSW